VKVTWQQVIARMIAIEDALMRVSSTFMTPRRRADAEHRAVFGCTIFGVS